MASNYTTNYQLNQWAASDQFLRTEFNTDNQKIDAALKALNGDKAELVFGSYTGDGTAQRTISLGFTPRAVLVFSSGGMTADSATACGGLALPNAPVEFVFGAAYTVLKIVTGGFFVSYLSIGASRYISTNASNNKYHYLSVR